MATCMSDTHSVARSFARQLEASPALVQAGCDLIRVRIEDGLPRLLQKARLHARARPVLRQPLFATPFDGDSPERLLTRVQGVVHAVPSLRAEPVHEQAAEQVG